MELELARFFATHFHFRTVCPPALPHIDTCREFASPSPLKTAKVFFINGPLERDENQNKISILNNL